MNSPLAFSCAKVGGRIRSGVPAAMACEEGESMVDGIGDTRKKIFGEVDDVYTSGLVRVLYFFAYSFGCFDVAGAEAAC